MWYKDLKKVLKEFHQNFLGTLAMDWLDFGDMSMHNHLLYDVQHTISQNS